MKYHRGNSERKETEASILMIVVVDFLCLFYGLGDTLQGGELFQLSMTIPRTSPCFGHFYGNVVSDEGYWRPLVAGRPHCTLPTGALRPGDRQMTSLHLLCCIYEPYTVRGPLPGHGYDHTHFGRGVSVAGFHILFKQWFLCVSS